MSVVKGKGARSLDNGHNVLTFLEDLRAVDPHQAGVGIFILLAVAHVGQLNNRIRQEKRRWGCGGLVVVN